MLEHLTPEQKFRMHLLAMSIHCNEEVTGETPFIIKDAAQFCDFVLNGDLPMTVRSAEAEASFAIKEGASITGPVTLSFAPPAMAGTSLKEANPDRIVLPFPTGEATGEASNVGTGLQPDPIRKERKKRGPNKVKAAKAPKAKRGRPAKAATTSDVVEPIDHIPHTVELGAANGTAPPTPAPETGAEQIAA